MTDHPDFLNVRNLFFSIAASPFLLLLLLGLIDISWHHTMTHQVADLSCTQTTVSAAIKPDDSACPQ
jgi:hypothetical protein